MFTNDASCGDKFGVGSGNQLNFSCLKLFFERLEEVLICWATGVLGGLGVAIGGNGSEELSLLLRLVSCNKIHEIY